MSHYFDLILLILVGHSYDIKHQKHPGRNEGGYTSLVPWDVVFGMNRGWDYSHTT